MIARRDEIATLLRRRVLVGLRTGHLQGGDRLPSTRELSGRLAVDPRVVLAAYRDLAEEGLVELRPRSGIYVAGDAPAPGDAVVPAESWLVEVLAEGVRREVPAPELGEWIRRSVETLRLRAAVIAWTTDQLEGIGGELRTDYGVEVDSVPLDRLAAGGTPPAELRRADLIVTTEALEPQVRPLADRLGKPLVLAVVRPDLVGDEWRRLLSQTVYVVVTDPRFGELVREYFAKLAPDGGLQVLVADRDDVSAIPADSPVYVTRSARERLAGREVPGRILPTARIFSPSSSRAILAFIVNANLTAAAARATGRML